MSGCPGCLISEKERNEQIINKTIKAKSEAVEKQKLYIIYSLPDGSVDYMEAEAARQAGIIPIKYISWLL